MDIHVLVVITILVAVVIWFLTLDRKKLKELRRLRHVVKLANAGNENARLACERDPRIAKGIVYIEETGTVKACYSVSVSSVFRPFGV